MGAQRRRRRELVVVAQEVRGGHQDQLPLTKKILLNKLLVVEDVMEVGVVYKEVLVVEDVMEVGEVDKEVLVIEDTKHDAAEPQ